jgi:ATP-binding cassette subfamily C protein
MKEKTAQGHKAKKQGLIRLASVMDKACATHARHEFSDPLPAACSSVAESLELEVTLPPPPAEEAVTRKLTVQDIAASSGFNVRQVTLPGGWWRKDLGPLLGFSAKDHAPQALIPVSATRYEVVNPGTQERARVTARTAAAIGPKAYTFYRPFPDKPLNGWDLVRFGLKGCGKDLKYVLLLASAIGLLGLVVPLATAQIFNHIIPNADRAQIWGILAIIAGFAVTTILFETCRNISLLRVENRLYYALDAALWDRLIRLSTPFFRQYETGDLTTRAMGMSMVRQLISGPVITVMISSFFPSLTCF